MTAVEQVAAAVQRGADRIVAAIDRVSACPECRHDIDTPGCRCERDDCACGGGAR